MMSRSAAVHRITCVQRCEWRLPCSGVSKQLQGTFIQERQRTTIPLVSNVTTPSGKFIFMSNYRYPASVVRTWTRSSWDQSTREQTSCRIIVGVIGAQATCTTWQGITLGHGSARGQQPQRRVEQALQLLDPELVCPLPERNFLLREKQVVRCILKDHNRNQHTRGT